MSSDYDATEFVDDDFQDRHKAPSSSPAGTSRAPTREETDAKLAQAQQKLAALKREKEEEERKSAALQETQRRQIEFQTGRQEMIQHLTRGVGLLEEAELASRRDAEQMAKSLVDMKQALGKVEAVREDSWTQENFPVELTRGLTAIENARMEWNAARLKFPILTPNAQNATAKPADDKARDIFQGRSFLELCSLGLALTWPVALVVLLIFAALLSRR